MSSSTKEESETLSNNSDTLSNPNITDESFYIDPTLQTKQHDSLIYGGLHRRYLPVKDSLEQEPSQKYDTIPALIPSNRPKNTNLNHGVFATYNNHAEEVTQTMTDRMCEGTYGDNKYPLHYAAYKDNVATIRKLLKTTKWRKSGGDIQVEDNLSGRTALHVACSYGHKDVCEALLKSKDVNINSIDYWGWSPLMYAIHSGHETVVRWLISRKGAWLSVHGSRQETAHTLSQIEHRGHVLQRYALTNYIRETENNLTSQSMANGWKGTFGTHVHFTRPKLPYRKITATFPLQGNSMVLLYRIGEFGLKWATRTISFERIDRPDDNTKLIWSECQASQTAYEAAVHGHVKSEHAKGYGKPIEEWMTQMSIGNSVVELIVHGGRVIIHENEENVVQYMDSEIKETDGIKRESELPLESIRLELPMPNGIHASFMMRILEERISLGKEKGRINWLKEEEARKIKPRPSLFRRMSSIFISKKSIKNKTAVDEKTIANLSVKNGIFRTERNVSDKKEEKEETTFESKRK